MVTEQAVRSLVGTALSCTNKYNMNAHARFVKEVALVPEASALGEGLEMTAGEEKPRGLSVRSN